MPIVYVDWTTREIASHIIPIATDRHGCCVVQRSWDCWYGHSGTLPQLRFATQYWWLCSSPSAHADLFRAIMSNALPFMADAFANYVVQARILMVFRLIS
jgi:hypothetical protein